MEVNIEEVDTFLTSPKTLKGPPPEWKISSRGDHEAIWIIRDDLQIEVGQLRFRCSRQDFQWPSVSLIFRGRSVWRGDLVPMDECKPNPPDAYLLGLDPRVCGPHEHAWPDNRKYVAKTGHGDLPFRRAVQPQIQRVEQLLPWFAERINLTLDEGQRGETPKHEIDTRKIIF